MNVIRHGMLNNDDKYKMTCPKCNCYFAYGTKDITFIGYDDIGKVVCPDCGYIMSAETGNTET